MIRKSAVSALALALLSPALLSARSSGLERSYYPQVKQVICDHSRGSAFLIEGDKYVSAAHVTDDTGCTIDGLPIEAVAEFGLDLSIAPAPPSKIRGFKVNCAGFKPGEWVFASGYARGWEWQTLLRLLATWQTDDVGKRIIFGYPQFIPGMSGTAVLNGAGEATGVVNSYYPGQPYSASRQLKDSSLCRGAGAIA